MAGKHNSNEAPDAGQLPKYLGFATLGALVLLIIAVLPAEYGIDPTGIGRLTGLSQLSEDHPEGVSFESNAKTAEIYPTAFQTETIRIDIEEFGELEYKAYMPEGGSFVYSWQILGDTPKGGVFFEFHGHPSSEDADNYPEDFFQAYSEGERSAQNGAFIAPFPGYHGWFFLNLEERPITMELTIAGFYDKHLELYRAVEGEIVTSVDH